MAFDGNGTFSLLYTWSTEAASPPIAISKLDAEMAGLAAALSSCLLRSGGGLTGPLSISTSSSHLALYETGGADPADRALVELDGGLMRLLAYDNSAAAWRYFLSGNVSTGAVNAYGAWTFDGAVTIGTEAVATLATGSFTATLRASTPGGSSLATGTAYWNKSGKVVTLRLPVLQATTTATLLYVTGLPSDIYPAAQQNFVVPAVEVAEATSAACIVLETGGVKCVSLEKFGGWSASSVNKGFYGSGYTTLTYVAD